MKYSQFLFTMGKRLIQILIFLLTIIIYLFCDCKAQWIQIPEGMGTNKSISCLVLSGNNLYTSTYNDGIYYTSTGGANWIHTPIDSLNTISIAVSGINIFFGLNYYCILPIGLYRSLDGGLTFEQTSLTERLITSILINDSKIFAGCLSGVFPGGVYLSSDNGSNWMQTSIFDDDVWCLAANNNILYAGLAYGPYSPGGLYSSTNSGENWSLLGLSNKNIYSIAFKDNIIIAGTGASIYLTSNNGTNWIQTSITNRQVNALAVKGNYIFAGTETGGIYLSSNNGTNWIQKNQGLDTFNIHSLALTNEYIFAGTMGRSVWRRSLAEIVNIKNVTNNIPVTFELGQNYPNPFNQCTMFNVQCSIAGNVRINVYDITGREVVLLVNKYLQAGMYEVRFESGDLPSGIYFCKMTADEFSDVKRIVLLK